MKSNSIFRRHLCFSFAFLASLTFVNAGLVRPAGANDNPTAADALKLKPTQSRVEYDTPPIADQEKCTVKTLNTSAARGWLVLDPDGILLRRFLDTNQDNKLDRWCYYKNGVEVYRDIDENFNGVADQHRWLGTSGIRWGIDKDEDGAIDQWRMISAEEVTAEIVAAIQDSDVKRFQRILLTEDELESLGLGEAQTEEIEQKLEAAQRNFNDFVRAQDAIDEDTSWLHFGGTRPGLIPAGTDGSTKDLMVYDNVAAIIESGGTHSQLSIGTLIRVGDTWRAIELPEEAIDGQASTNGGLFYQASLTRVEDETQPDIPSGVDTQSQELLEEYDEIDRQLAATTNRTEIARLNGRRADLLILLANAARDNDNRMNWIRQFADTVSGAYQTGEYPQGLAKLAEVERQLRNSRADKSYIAYVHYRYMNAVYTRDIQADDADLAKIQTEWLQSLSDFVKEYPSSEHAADAMLQLALAEEFAGEDQKAIAWYQQIVRSFPQTPVSEKATGAQRRLTSVDKVVEIRGESLEGDTIATRNYRGKVVVVHYWASWCQLCKDEFQVLKEMQAKYGRQGLVLIGINLDSDKQTANAQMEASPLPWPQLHEDGGLDGRLANELGIVTLPTMLLLDKQGKVVRRNMTAAELDNELRRLLR